MLKKRLLDLLEEMELDHLKDKYPHELSGGQKQRVGIARDINWETGVIING